MGTRKDLLNAVFVGIAQKQAARLAPNLREALAALTHRRRINDGQQLLSVLGNERVEKRLIVVLQVAHVGVLVKRRWVVVEHAFASLALIFKVSDVRRQQAVQRKCVALCLSERSTF